MKNSLLLIIFLSLIALIPIAGATVISASNIIQYSNDTNVNTASTSMVKLAELTMNDSYTGSFRVYFELACGDWHNQCSMDGVNTYARVYKNGVIYGALWDWLGGSPSQAFQYLPYSQDFTGLSISAGDKIQLYAYENNAAASGVAYVQNFRVEFDTPTLISATANNDTYITDASPTSNYGTDTKLEVGNSTSNYSGLVQFNLSSIPSNAIINSATMNLYEYSGGNSGSYVLAYNATSAWNETNVTWNTAPTSNAVSIASIAGVDAATWYKFNITSSVKAWVAGTLSNNGLVLKENVSGYNLFFYTKEYSSGLYSPYIAVNFTPQYTPPTPTNIGATTGNFWVNTTWQAGTGCVTDLYNVSVNGTWVNGSSVAFMNTTGMAAHGWANASVYAYNSSGSGTLNTTPATKNTQIPNNLVIISNISSTYYLNPGGTLSIFPTSSDADSDTPTFATNANKGTFYTNNGTLVWTAVANDSGTYNWYINVTDGYGSVATKSFSVSVNSSIPGAVTNLANMTGNFWVNYTWVAGVGTDSYNISVNGTWSNGTTANFSNTTVSPHGWANITVVGYNASSRVVGNSSSQNTQVPDNLPVYGSTSISNAAIYTTGSTTIEIDSVTDADNDSINITVGVTLLGGNEVNNTMVQTAGTNNWTYPFSTLTTGTYTVTHFYISTAYGNVTKSDTLQFTVTNAPSYGGGGGGGGSSSTTTVIVTGSNVTNVTPLLLLQNLTTGATEPEIEAISKCITEGLFMVNSCSGNNFGIQVDPANYWIFLGTVVASFSVVGAQTLRGKKRNWVLDSLLYGAVTIIIVVALEFVGVNMYFLNYIVDSPKYAWAFFSVMAWGLFISVVGDYLSYREGGSKGKKKVYKLTDEFFQIGRLQ